MFNPSTNPCFEGQTHEDCIINCQIREFIEKTGRHPPINLARSNSSLYFANKSEYELFKWSDRCDRMCGRFTDCYKEYCLIKDGEILTDYNEYQIMIDFPTHPTTEISLKMCFEEYLCLIASILSIWFGFSVIMLSDFCEEIFKKLYHKQNIKVFFIRRSKKIYQANITNIMSITNN